MATVTYDTRLALSEMGHRRDPQALRLPASNPSNRLLHSMSPLLAQSGHCRLPECWLKLIPCGPSLADWWRSEAVLVVSSIEL
jgi:hypothetical protein